MRNIKNLLLILCLLFFASCKKLRNIGTIPPPIKLTFDYDNLPVVAYNGGNYFGYLIDGNPTWGQKKNILDSRVKAKYNDQEKSLSLDFSSDVRSVFINLKSIEPKVGQIYQLKDILLTPQSSFASYYEDGPSTTFPSGNIVGTIYIFSTTNDTPNYVKITYLNWETRIITGEFDLTVRRMDQTVNRGITKGRFDLKF